MSVVYSNALQSDPAAEFDSLTNSAQLSLDPDVSIRAGGSFRFLGSGASAYGQLSLTSAVYTSHVYFQIDALPAATASLIQGQGTSSAFAFQIAATGHPVPKIGSGRTDIGFTFAAATWYRLDQRWDASGTTWTLDYQISDGLTEALLYTATQLTLAGQVASSFTAYRVGQNGTASLSGHAEDLQVNNDSASYPIGAWTYTPPPVIIPIGKRWLPSKGKSIMLGLRSDWGASVPATIATREAQLGRKVLIAHTFRSWNDATRRLSDEQALVQTGHVPLVSWPNAGGVPTTGGSTGTGAIKGIAAGDYDSNITTFAQNLEALASPVVLLRLSWEMNGSVNPWRDSPADYVAMFNHVQGIMRQYTTKVKMVWCPQRRATNTNSYLWHDYEPPDPDLYGIDAYSNAQPDFQGNLLRSGDYPSATGLDRDWYATYSGRGKPLIVCETGCRETTDPTQPGGASQSFSKAAWFTDWKTGAQSFPELVGWVVFDKSASGDWRVDTTLTPGTYDTAQATFQEFQKLALHPYWNPAYALYKFGATALVGP